MAADDCSISRMSNFSIDTGAVRIFCSNKDADTTTSSPNKIVSSNLIFCAKSSDDLIKIDVVSYPIPLISILNGYSAFIFKVKSPLMSDTDPIVLLDDRYIFIPTNFSEFKSDTVPDIVLV